MVLTLKMISRLALYVLEGQGVSAVNYSLMKFPSNH